MQEINLLDGVKKELKKMSKRAEVFGINAKSLKRGRGGLEAIEFSSSNPMWRASLEMS